MLTLKGLYYSVVDINQNVNMGDVIQRNILTYSICALGCNDSRPPCKWP